MPEQESLTCSVCSEVFDNGKKFKNHNQRWHVKEVSISVEGEFALCDFHVHFKILYIGAVLNFTRDGENHFVCTTCGVYRSENRSTFSGHVKQCASSAEGDTAMYSPLRSENTHPVLAPHLPAAADGIEASTLLITEGEGEGQTGESTTEMLNVPAPLGNGTCEQVSAPPTELCQVGILGKIGFTIQKRLAAFLCITCKEIFPPSHVAQHAKKHFHKKTFPGHLGGIKAVKAQVQAIAVSKGIHSGFPAVPTCLQEPFQGLSVLSCTQCQADECSYIAGTPSTQKWHASSEHASTHCAWMPVLAQRFQKKQPLFQVNAAGKAQDVNTFGVFKERFLHHADLHLLPLNTVHNRDITPYLRFTQWHVHLKDYVEDMSERTKLVEWIKRPKKGAHGIYQNLQQLINRYVDEFRTTALGMDFKCREPFEHYPV